MAKAQTPAPAPAPAPVQAINTANANRLTGLWRWTQFDGSCTETLQYKNSGELLAVSRQSTSKWTYQFDKTPTANGFYRVLETLSSDNGKPDCAGNLIEAAQTRGRFVQLSPTGNLLLVCSSDSLAACYGPLTKQPGENW